MTSHIDRLGRRLADVEEGLKRLARSNNLGHSSFDGGSIQQNADDGTPGSVFGVSFDGTNGVVPLTSPPPPTPTWDDAVTDVAGVIGGISVRWSGLFEGGPMIVAPLGFASVEVHVSDTPDFSALLFETMKTSITSPRGGEVLIPLTPGTYYVRLVCRTTAGRAGSPSQPAGPIEARSVVREDLGFDLSEIAGNKVFRGDTEPVATADEPLLYGDLWLQTPANVAHRYEPDGAGGGIWNTVQDQNIVQAINDAADAAGLAASAGLSASQAHDLATAANAAAGNAVDTANQASEAAQAAMDAAQLAQQSGGTGINVYRQTSAPVGGTYHINDLWLDTAHNNMLFAWSGGAWVESDDQRIATALTNASAAQTLAGAKTTLFAQVSAPATTGRAIGDTWIDTDDSNRVYVWTGSAWTVTLFGAAALNATARQLGAVTTYRQASAPTGVLIAGDLWIDSATNKLYSYSGTAWVASQDVGIQTALTNAGTAQTTANNKTTTFYQTSAPATTGRSTGDLWIDTDDGNKIYTWNGAAWAATTLSSQALNVTARQLGAITIYRQTSQPTSGMILGDYWIDSSPTGGNKAYLYQAGGWVIVQDAAIQSALANAATAQATADGKAVIYYQTSQPTGQSALDIGDEWVDTDDAYVTYTWSGTAWVKNAISTSSFKPNSLVASTVVATGSITAALLEATLVLATTIIAGNINGTHAKMQPDGFHVFRADPTGGAPMEVIRLGVASTNDYFAIVSSAGLQSASIDDTGTANLYGVNSRTDPIFQGTRFMDWIRSASGIGNGNPAFPGAQHTIGWIDGSIGGVKSEIGLIEVQVQVDANRWYEVGCEVNYVRGTDTEAVFRVRDGGTGSPTISSQEVYRRNFSNGQAFYDVTTGSSTGIWYPATSGTHRLLLTAAAQGSGVIDVHTLLCLPTIICRDMGPRKPITASVNRGGGTATPPPVQQYVELPPAGWASFRGDGSLRTDTSDVVSGYDPSGYNGDGRGYWWFNLPTITGSIDRIDFYSFANHWYYNGGGTAILNCSDVNGTGSPQFVKRASDLTVGFSGAPSGVTATLPSSWYPLFKTGSVPRVNAITVGPGGGTNETYYGRFNGGDPRLRIWFTQ